MAFDGYLQIEGIEGECTDAEHENWIHLLSYSHGMSQESTATSSGGMHTGGRVDHADITLVKVMDSATPGLQLACCQGKSHPTAVIEFCRSGGESVLFFKVELTDVVVTSVTPQASGGSDFPCEEVSLTYRTIQWTYTKTDTRGKPQGEVVSGWNLAENTKL